MCKRFCKSDLISFLHHELLIPVAQSASNARTGRFPLIQPCSIASCNKRTERVRAGAIAGFMNPVQILQQALEAYELGVLDLFSNEQRCALHTNDQANHQEHPVLKTTRP